MGQKAADFIQNAEECRRLARVLNVPEHRELLLDMAATWERLANERRRGTVEAGAKRRAGVPFVSAWPENK